VTVGDNIYQGLLYYGINILTNQDCLEVHIIDFNGDIYDESITVVTQRYMRFPRRFKGLNELAVQIKKDLNFSKKLLG
jgi:riboflavin kinase / FMN adenylyltransferase